MDGNNTDGVAEVRTKVRTEMGQTNSRGEMYKGTHGSEGTDKIVGRGSDGATEELTSDNSVTDTTEEGRGKDGQVRPYVPVQGGVGRVRRNDDGK